MKIFNECRATFEPQTCVLFAHRRVVEHNMTLAPAANNGAVFDAHEFRWSTRTPDFEHKRSTACVIVCNGRFISSARICKSPRGKSSKRYDHAERHPTYSRHIHKEWGTPIGTCSPLAALELRIKETV